MNKSAVALAADSKVTVTVHGVSKTYDTVSKLFTISKFAPVGIMIYGNAEFMGYPWETIIKMYREQKGRHSEPLVQGWADDFFQYLDRFGKITDENKRQNVSNICMSTLSGVLERYSDIAIRDKISHGTEEYEEGLRGYLRDRVTNLGNMEPWATSRQTDALVKSLADPVVEAINSLFKGYQDETRELALQLALGTLLFKSQSPQVSGIVFAGFGDSEYFPTLVEYRTEGYVGNKLKIYKMEPTQDVCRSNPSCIRAFAQHEMVRRFMDGIDPYYSGWLDRELRDLVLNNCLATLDKYGSKAKKVANVREEITSAVTKAIEIFERDARSYRLERFSEPVMRMVSVLPKDELAHLAESLVALTSLKRRVSSDAETVGGPIDVALISKGDGFIWIKRKHYFREELNPHFVRTYMDRIPNGERDDAEPGPVTGRGRAAEARPPRVRSGGKGTPKAADGGR